MVPAQSLMQKKNMTIPVFIPSFALRVLRCTEIIFVPEYSSDGGKKEMSLVSMATGGK